MQAQARTLVKGVMWIGTAMIVIVVLHLGGSFALHVGQFAPLTGAFIGGTLVIASVLTPIRQAENAEPWIGYEQRAWILIGFGIIMWGCGETFWRYYISIGQAPFPSIADIGYSSFPLLVFIGLLLQPPAEVGSRRFLLLMDSLISMGSILAIAWYLLLGSLAQAPGEANLAKFLGLYYPISDTALVSCVVFLLLRGQGRTYQATARRTGLLLVGVGLCFFVASDFVFNIEQNMGTYVEATWIDLGWPLGMMTIGIAACLRRFSPATSAEVIQRRAEQITSRTAFGPARFVPYTLLALLFLTLSLNVLSTDDAQRAIRPLLLFATMSVVALVVARQIYTLWENARLAAEQAEALEELGRANRRIEEQAHQIAEHNAELEQGIIHLKDVQAQLANGNLRARAYLTSGALLPLAGSLNLMAERLMRLGQASVYVQRLVRALSELSIGFERTAPGTPLMVPASCNELMEINRLLLALRMKGTPIVFPSTQPLRPGQGMPTPHPITQPLVSGSHNHASRPVLVPQAAPEELQELPKRLGVRPPASPGLLRSKVYESKQQETKGL
jgi:hypothetical protein